MAKIISFISRKGGTGKTTNAINLATMLHNLGHRLMLIETDTNFTLNTLRKMELYKTGAKDDTLFRIVGSDNEDLVEEIERLRSNGTMDFIIVDSAGKTTDESIKKLCLLSDAILVPTSLTQNDMLVTYQTIEDIKPAKDLNPKLQILVLPNRIHTMTKIETIRNALKELDADILNVKVPSKKVFSSSSTILPEKEYLEITKDILQHMP
jgi:chromosome partitioning protein